MGFIDDVISTGKNAVSAAGKTTDKAVKFSKLKMKESSLNSDIKTKYEKLGELIYRMAKSGEKSNEEFDAYIAELDACYEGLAEISNQLDDLRNEVTCPKCGAKTKNDNAFCPKCGAKLPEKAVEPETEPKVEE